MSTRRAFSGDERTVAGRAVVGQYVEHVQGSDFVENGDPTGRSSTVVGDAGRGFVLDDIAGDEGAVGFDEDQLIAFAVRASEPEQADRCAAKIDLRFVGVNHVGRAQIDVGEKLIARCGC